MRALFVAVIALSFAAGVHARPSGISQPKTAAELVQTLEPMLPGLLKPGPALTALLGDAEDVRASVGDDFSRAPPADISADPVSADGVAVDTLAGPATFVSFYDSRTDRHLVLMFGHRKVPKQPDVLVLLDAPYVEKGRPAPMSVQFREDATWLVKKGASWAQAPLPDWFVPRARAAACMKTLTDTTLETYSNEVLYALQREDRSYTADVSRLAMAVPKGAKVKVKLSKDKQHFTAEVTYAGGVARIDDVDATPKIVKPCVDP